MTPAADQPQPFRHRADAQRAVVAEDVLLVEGRTRQGTRAGAGGHDDVLSDQLFHHRRSSS
jgi:hypothetical protein